MVFSDSCAARRMVLHCAPLLCVEAVCIRAAARRDELRCA
ncbi:hypothetical protein A2U01_0114983, partial [Trifolium medium]|nr:hypothetical protein [Trifolium medium]